MKISYKSRKLERSVATPGAIKTNYGTRAKLVNIRLEELASAKNLETMRNITKAGWRHGLVGYCPNHYHRNWRGLSLNYLYHEL
jgi:hypothetical protein